MLTQACLAGLLSTCLMPLFLAWEAYFRLFNLLRFLPSQSPCPEHLLHLTDTYLLDKLQVSADTSFLTLRLGQFPIFYDFIEAGTPPAAFLARL